MLNAYAELSFSLHAAACAHSALQTYQLVKQLTTQTGAQRIHTKNVRTIKHFPSEYTTHGQCTADSTHALRMSEMISEMGVLFMCANFCVCLFVLLPFRMANIYRADAVWRFWCASRSFTGDMGTEPASRSTSRHRCHD